LWSTAIRRSSFAGLQDDRWPLRREITLMNVQVPASQLLGTEGEGVAALEPAATAPSQHFALKPRG